MEGTAIEMPQYRSHKTVRALKIKAIEVHHRKTRQDLGGATITPAEEGYAPFWVDHRYVVKHEPKAGGYFVVYEDGYTSWSPAEAFESGYTRVSASREDRPARDPKAGGLQ